MAYDSDFLFFILIYSIFDSFSMYLKTFPSKMRLGISLNCPSSWGKSEAHYSYEIVLMKNSIA